MIYLPTQLQPIGASSGAWDRAWYEWAWRVTTGVNRNWGAGATLDRPTGASVGDYYFDTTLVLPIWYSGAIWIKADGTPA